MAKLGEPVHPNVTKAAMSERARYLFGNRKAAHARQSEILSMRSAGQSVPHIAKHFGISTSRVYKLLQRCR